ncbi:MAG: CTAG/PCC1 family protein [Candidatus Diapherotrites archaeon]
MSSQKIVVDFHSRKAARAAFQSLNIETGQAFEKRSKTIVNVEKNALLFSIVGKDAHTAHASADQYEKLALYLKHLINYKENDTHDGYSRKSNGI